MAAPGSIERRNPHEPVHAFLRFQIAIGIIAFDQHRDTLDAGLVARQIVEQLDFEAALLRPAACTSGSSISAPVLRLRAACARMQLQDRVQLVVRLVQQQLQLETRQLRSQAPCTLCSMSASSDSSLFFFRQLQHHLQIFVLRLPAFVIDRRPI